LRGRKEPDPDDREGSTEMTEQTKGAPSGDPLEQEIEDLDREAREALDRLADKREEMERRHQATDFAAQRQREREEKRWRREAAETQERERRRRVEKAEELGRRRLELEERAEGQARALVSTLEDLLALDPRHERAVRAAHGKAPAQFVSMTFRQVLSGWFVGRFGGTHGLFPGIGHDAREGLGLVERDALTPPKGSSPGPSPAGGEGAAEPAQNGTES
jgi:hypothetical protein